VCANADNQEGTSIHINNMYILSYA